MKTLRITLLITIILVGASTAKVAAQSRRDSKKEKRTEKRPEKTSSAIAIYGSSPARTKYKMGKMQKVKRQGRLKPARGTRSHSWLPFHKKERG